VAEAEDACQASKDVFNPITLRSQRHQAQALHGGEDVTARQSCLAAVPGARGQSSLGLRPQAVGGLVKCGYGRDVRVLSDAVAPRHRLFGQGYAGA
jgi:hypothetical protein